MVEKGNRSVGGPDLALQEASLSGWKGKAHGENQHASKSGYISQVAPPKPETQWIPGEQTALLRQHIADGKLPQVTKEASHVSGA